MTKIKIPEAHLKGFQRLAAMTPNEFDELRKQFFEQLPIDKAPSVQEIQKTFNELNQENDMVSAMLGFLSFSISSESPISDIYSSFEKAYAHQVDDVENADQLLLRLKSFYNDAASLRCTMKALSLIRESEHVYSDSRVLTDVRPVFNDEDAGLVDGNYAIILHRLKLERMDADGIKEIFLSMTRTQLEELKGVIERAIEKDQTLRDEQLFQYID